MHEGNLLNAEVLVAEGLLERGKLHSECRVNVTLFHGNGSTELIPDHARAKLDGTEPVGVQGDTHFAVPGSREQFCVADHAAVRHVGLPECRGSVRRCCRSILRRRRGRPVGRCSCWRWSGRDHRRRGGRCNGRTRWLGRNLVRDGRREHGRSKFLHVMGGGLGSGNEIVRSVGAI